MLSAIRLADGAPFVMLLVATVIGGLVVLATILSAIFIFVPRM